MLKGKIAIVTGGGRGLGRAIAAALADEGAAVAVVARTKDDLERTVSLIADKGGHAVYIRADVSDSGDVSNLVKTVETKLGVTDILVNNAGIIGPVAELIDADEEGFDYCMGVNFKAAFLLSRLVVPGMIRKKAGKIINVTSGLADFVMPRLGAYAVSKAALNHLTRVLARELEDYGIQVNGLDPGTVDTKMQETLRGMDIKKIGPEGYRAFWGLKQSGQLRDPARAARLAVFLASVESDAITGEIGAEDHFMRLGYKAAA